MKTLLLFAIAGVCFAQELPDKRLTPGTTVAVSVEQICIVGYSRTVRNVPIEEKREVYARYRIKYVPHTYEVDHLIPLSLGGANTVENLWPEPYAGEWGADAKDRLELELHRMVCRGELSLTEAQGMIANNWIAAYREVFSRVRERKARVAQ